MLTLRAIHAHEGDCLLLIHGNGDRFVLIDGGPKNTFDPHLKAVLANLQPRRLEAVCLSHVDTDHTTGLNDLFAELRDLKDEGKPALVEVDNFWINEFSDTVDADGGNREQRLDSVLNQLSAAGQTLALASTVLDGIQHGHGLVVLATQLGIPINKPSGGKPFIAGETKGFKVGDLAITVVGPTKKNLERLRKSWEHWLDKQEERIARGRFQLAANLDSTIPNNSSTALLVEHANTRTLLTGDARGDHILDALEELDLLDDEGGIDLDVLKVQHHGSDRNADLDFFLRCRAKTYVISANGRDGNPDGPTLHWLYKAAKKQQRPFKLVLTNLPEDAQEFVQHHPPGNEYELVVRADGDDFVDVEIVP
jgi:beta-lactamase superfamily II metal-dependent hydrolase